MLILAFLVTTVSAFDFDNIKTYNETAKEVTIKNAFGLPLIGDDIAKLRLNTPIVNYVPIGQNKLVAEITIESYTDYANVFDKIKFYDGKDLSKEYNKTFTYKVKSYISKKRDILEWAYDDKNGTWYQEVIGKEDYVDVEWNTKADKDIKKENITIGIFVDEVKKGDYVEWIPEMFGEVIDEWAIYAADPALLAYWDFDEGTGSTATDAKNGIVFTLTDGSAWTTTNAKLGAGAIWHTGTGNYLTTPDDARWEFANQTAFSHSFWFNSTYAANRIVYDKDGNGGYSFQENNDIFVNYGNSVGGSTPSGSIRDNVWTFFTVTVNETNGVKLYVNGTLYSQGQSGTRAYGSQPFIIGERQSPAYAGFIGMIDEFAVWNRTLSDADVLELYANGAGFAYPFSSITNITLTYPANNTNFTSVSTETLNATGFLSTDTATFINATRYLWYPNGTLVNTLYSETIYSGNKTSFTFSSVPQGTYDWGIEMCTNDGFCAFSSNRTFNYTAPEPSSNAVILISPADNSSTNNQNVKFSANMTTISGGTKFSQINELNKTVWNYSGYPDNTNFFASSFMSIEDNGGQLWASGGGGSSIPFYIWNGTWVYSPNISADPATIDNGLVSDLFKYNNTLYVIAWGQTYTPPYTVPLYSYKWNGTNWIDAEFTAYLSNLTYDNGHALRVFNYSGTVNLINMDNGYGHHWNGTGWVTNYTFSNGFSAMAEGDIINYNNTLLMYGLGGYKEWDGSTWTDGSTYNFSIVPNNSISLFAYNNSLRVISLVENSEFNNTIYSYKPSAVVNGTLFIYSGDSTIRTNFSNSPYTFDTINWTVVDLDDGTYTWNAQLCNYNSTCNMSLTNYTFTLDTSKPLISVISPANGSYAYTNNATRAFITLNITQTDATPDKCWYNSSWNSTINFVTCAANTQITTDNIYGAQTIYAYANDTFGNENSTSSTFNIHKNWINNFNYYETENVDFALQLYNISTFPNLAYLEFNGVNYSATITSLADGTYFLNRSADVPIGATNRSFKWYWTDSTFRESRSWNITSSEIILALRNSTLPYSYLNVSFRIESNDTAIAAAIPSSTFVYYLGSGGVNKTFTYANTTANLNYSFAFSPQNKTLKHVSDISYSATGYPTRRTQITTDLTNSSIEKILYLLGTNDGISASYQVTNSFGTPITGVLLVIQKFIGTEWTTIETDSTDGSGLATFWLDPYADHRITASKSGYATQTFINRPTQSIYTIVLGESIAGVTYNSSLEGISWLFRPAIGPKVANVSTNFNVTIQADKGNLVSCLFRLSNQTANISSTTSSCISTGGFLSINYTPQHNERIKGTLLVNIGQGYITADTDSYWIFYQNFSTQGTLYNIFGRIKNLNEFGDGIENEFSRVVWFFLILVFGLGLITLFTGYDFASPGITVLIVYGIILFASVAGWFNFGEGFPLISQSVFAPNQQAVDFLNQYMYAIIMGMFTGGWLINNWRRMNG